MKEAGTAAEKRVLLFAIFIVSLCGIIYELVLGSLATYLLGNPVVQYSITIGFFLSSMGLGSFLSRFVTEKLVLAFIVIEIILGLAGGLSVLLLNYIFSFTTGFYIFHILFLVIIGTLVGMEIPLLTRILKKHGSLKTVISDVLSIDYFGGLAGSLLFPLLLFPFTGRFAASVITGMANIAVAIAVMIRVEYEGKKRIYMILPAAGFAILALCLYFSGEISRHMQGRLYADDIVFSRRSMFQEIVLTRSGDDFRLYLDGSIQFSTSDEYRYHEMLVHPSMSGLSGKKTDILVMGGGDGIAVREILKYTDVASVVLVELDPMMIELATKNSSFIRINHNSLADKRVKIIVGDAYKFLIDNRRKFDLIIADFSDPHDETLTKLYTREFYRLAKRSLRTKGIFVTQSTSPLAARTAFWCINNTLADVFRITVPYHVYVPSFGDWGFVMAGDVAWDYHDNDEIRKLKFYNADLFGKAREFEPDCGFVKTEINTFDKPVLYSYYIRGWKYTD